MDYFEKLKDPRWQKKRLQIFERDNWTCLNCGATDKTLTVHHTNYQGKDPWETEDKYLKTLCEDCHDVEFNEKESREMFEGLLISSLKHKGFLTGDIVQLHLGFEDIPEGIDIRKLSWVLRHILRSKSGCEMLITHFYIER